MIDELAQAVLETAIATHKEFVRDAGTCIKAEIYSWLTDIAKLHFDACEAYIEENHLD